MRRLILAAIVVLLPVAGAAQWTGFPWSVGNDLCNDWYTCNSNYHVASQLWVAAYERYNAAVPSERSGPVDEWIPIWAGRTSEVEIVTNIMGDVTNITYYTNTYDVYSILTNNWVIDGGILQATTNFPGLTPIPYISWASGAPVAGYAYSALSGSSPGQAGGDKIAPLMEIIDRAIWHGQDSESDKYVGRNYVATNWFTNGSYNDWFSQYYTATSGPSTNIVTNIVMISDFPRETKIGRFERIGIGQRAGPTTNKVGWINGPVHNAYAWYTTQPTMRLDVVYAELSLTGTNGESYTNFITEHNRNTLIPTNTDQFPSFRYSSTNPSAKINFVTISGDRLTTNYPALEPVEEEPALYLQLLSNQVELIGELGGIATGDHKVITWYWHSITSMTVTLGGWGDSEVGDTVSIVQTNPYALYGLDWPLLYATQLDEMKEGIEGLTISEDSLTLTVGPEWSVTNAAYNRYRSQGVSTNSWSEANSVAETNFLTRSITEDHGPMEQTWGTFGSVTLNRTNYTITTNFPGCPGTNCVTNVVVTTNVFPWTFDAWTAAVYVASSEIEWWNTATNWEHSYQFYAMGTTPNTNFTSTSKTYAAEWAPHDASWISNQWMLIETNVFDTPGSSNNYTYNAAVTSIWVPEVMSWTTNATVNVIITTNGSITTNITTNLNYIISWFPEWCDAPSAGENTAKGYHLTNSAKGIIRWTDSPNGFRFR
jgi:hypothetical protein